jgi:hypothetical protein
LASHSGNERRVKDSWGVESLRCAPMPPIAKADQPDTHRG